MTTRRELRLNAFQMASPGHTWAGLWRHPRDTGSAYNSLDHWVDLAHTAERGLFDGVFLADVLGQYDVYGGTADAALARAAQAPNLDPFLVVPAMAQATRHLGFGVTANLTYEHPYPFARRITTLDHLTGGRVGWNIVTGYLESGARGMGQDSARAHDTRYEAGDDFLEAAYKLWEGSWEAGAVRRDRTGGVFTDPARVHRIRHDGPYYRVDGRHLAEPSPQRTPVLYQAGTSRRGKRFAGRHAEAVFLNGQTKALAAKAVRDLREAARAAGRDPYDIRVFLGATVIVAPTRAEALNLRDEYARYIDVEGQLALVSGWTGIDLSALGPDEALAYVRTNAMQSLVENLTQAGEPPFTRADFAEFGPRGARAPFIVGSPSEVADELVAWAEATDADGFNLTRAVAPETLAAFVDLVVPELQSRGAFKTRYAEGTLREKLFPGSGPLLKATHPGAGFRRDAAAALLAAS
ncbi:N5,N10-methylene tetrahydromethanopterin reductase [Methylobacterium sp. Leaf104]|uniref:LLM class flavin-dependent oxidoreductase n=1 Tax=Methylobacterium TaxID=407 RepID=UPI0006F38ED2|nr:MULTISPECIES: LLM class flavin-dependent oxidoreductase [Methylobacterium]KQP33792.1 N5,N10-methylene tetrahydromethanopterin reductase [Methylobacterium sp. Leaf104]MCI9879641.1 LLM class flavin-dependent oxidoreductase [Methylobacterium goesingense]